MTHVSPCLERRRARLLKARQLNFIKNLSAVTQKREHVNVFASSSVHAEV